ncbi:MAG TPA: phosphonate metabolism transcriptional regulator PhnF [Rhizobiaceae bacterium]|nr:phosphonate metabolism transcriptional regulator PhnF [Rhizobiaceae bacterium]
MNENRPFASTARWRQIADTLERDISSGYFTEGRLPTEPELAERFSVNRHTIRRAIGALVDQGLLKVTQGRGTFVADHQIDYLLGRRTRFSVNLRRSGRVGSHQLLSVTRKPADGMAAAELEIEPGAELIQLEAIGNADGVNLSYAIHSFPAARFEALPAAVAEKGSITAALAMCGVADYTRRVSRIVARLPTEREARYLDVPLSRPVLQVEAVNVDQEGKPIERTTGVFAGDRVQIVVEDETKA